MTAPRDTGFSSDSVTIPDDASVPDMRSYATTSPSAGPSVMSMTTHASKRPRSASGRGTENVTVGWFCSPCPTPPCNPDASSTRGERTAPAHITTCPHSIPPSAVITPVARPSRITRRSTVDRMMRSRPSSSTWSIALAGFQRPLFHHMRECLPPSLSNCLPTPPSSRGLACRVRPASQPGSAPDRIIPLTALPPPSARAWGTGRPGHSVASTSWSRNLGLSSSVWPPGSTTMISLSHDDARVRATTEPAVPAPTTTTGPRGSTRQSPARWAVSL